MAQEFKIGRLRFTWSGAWAPSTTYARDSVVSYQGKTYVCLLPNTSDSSNFYNDLYHVTQSGASTPYWNLILDGKSFVGQWTTNTPYSLGNIVIFGGVLYYCTTNHTSTAFASQTSNWSTYVQFTNWHVSWSTSTAYGINDVVKYGGIVYQCIADHTSAATAALGLEANQASWQILNQGIEYKGAWAQGTRYKAQDVVKEGPNLYICSSGHTSSSTFNSSGTWSIWIPGQEYVGTWNSGSVYQISDIVSYGGYNYISNTTNNTANVPSTDSTDWSVLNQGYELKNDWNNSTAYKIGDVVRLDGQLYEAVIDNTAQNPAAFAVTPTYVSAGSSGSTVVVSTATGIVVGMTVTGTGFTSGQRVISISGSNITLDRAPDASLTNGQTITFVGVNYLYWKFIAPGNYWTNTWINGTAYNIGDIVVWQNASYVCVTSHVASYVAVNPPTPNNRPDADSTNTYWIFFIAHARKNALNTSGDIEYYSSTSNGYTALPIGTNSYVLRDTNSIPTWSKVNLVPAVYYVSNTTGIDRVDYGTTWDQPWKTIRYACNFVGAGTQFPYTYQLLVNNKNWIITEMIQWTLYQISNSSAPYHSLFTGYTLNQTKAVRDAGYIIDAVAYDLARGGNSQTVAATLAYFQFGSATQFFNSAVAADVPYYLPMLSELTSLISNALANTAPSQSYQSLNNYTPVIYQYVNNTNPAELNGVVDVTSLLGILTTALTNGNTFSVPSANSGITASIFVKTGTYPETLPIVVPENTAIIGDELRGVVVEPAVAISTTCTAATTGSNLFTATTTTGFTDQMRLQFVDPQIATNITFTTFGGVTAGQNYYVVGSTVTPTQFSVTTSTGTYTYVTANSISTSGTGATFTVSPASSGAYNVAVSYGGAGYNAGDTIKILGSSVGATNGTNDILITVVTVTPVTGGIATFTSSSSTIFPVLSSATGTMGIYAGDCLQDMFRCRNGSGLRNMTLVGLLGTLSAPDSNYIQRPTGGSFACLDPGTGPNDTTAWIFRRSPYVQNVTAFGNGAGGLKIDGTLHNGGNKSMVANDFTHILNDGIGVWCTGPSALTEVVSVFSYYGYTGYFAEAGGRIRGTNGNTSYGQYGCIAEGYDITETPATGVVFNQSTQVQAQVQSSLGSSAQLVHINFSNAGSAYNTTSTNLLQYSNNYQSGTWTQDGNLAFNKVFTAPTGLTEAWTITGLSGTSGSSYLYQNITVNPAGAVYSNVSGVNISGSGSGATFNITVTSNAYTVTVNGGGTGYVTGNQIYIAGGQLGGKNTVNDCILTVSQLAGSSILAVTVSGTVPLGSNLAYTCSVYVYQGSGTSFDMQAIFSGTSTVTSSISYNFASGLITPSNTNGGLQPTQYGAQITLVSGWKRIWFSVYDTTGLNNTLQFRIYPKGINGVANAYNYFYGSQVEIARVPASTYSTWTASTAYSTIGQILLASPNFYQVTLGGTSGTSAPTFTTGSNTDGTVTESWIGSYAPSFYLENTTATVYTGYANYNITGAGTGAVAVGDETRSNSIFQTRVIADSNGISGGAGFLTAQNNAQAGNTTSIQLAQADTNTAGNYTGMRVFINSGTGAGQYGYIAYYNATTKTASVLKESFTSLQVINTQTSTNLFFLGSTTNTTTLYVNQIVQFIPTYYTTGVSSVNLSQVTVTSAVGGTTNILNVSSTAGLTVNAAVTFSAIGSNQAIFSDITAGYTYYIFAINPLVNGQATNNVIQISQAPFGTVWPLNSATGTMTMNFSNATSYLQASTTNMVPNYPIQFTGTALGGVTVGTVYYIQDIIDTNDFTISGTLVNITVTGTSSSTNGLTVASSASLIPLNPIVFSAPTIGGLTDGTKYYVSQIIDSQTFSVTASLITQNITATAAVTNLITTSSTSGFVTGQPIIFTGVSFDTGIIAETVYYILAINNSTTFTVSQTPGGGAITLVGGSGSMIMRTAPTPVTLTTASGTMTGTSTGNKTKLSIGIGTMNATFSTSLFGGVTAGTNYYITSINSGLGGSFTVSTSQSGANISLTNKSGSMNVAVVGWDHVNAGQPIVPALDSSSVYYIEPRTTYTAPGFFQSVASQPVTLAGGTSWIAIAYGKGTFVALPSANSTAAYSTDGNAWTSLPLPFAGNWTGIAYGNNYWVAINSGSNRVIYSNSNGAGWRSSTMPSNTSWSSITYGNNTFVAIASGTNSAAYSTNYGRTWTSTTLPASASWTSLTFGGGKFVAIASGGTQAAYSPDGNVWVNSTLPTSTTWNSITYGSGKFVAVSNTNNTSAYSFDGVTWYSSNIPITADKVAYGQGVFVAVSASSTTAWTSENALDWTQQTVTNDGYGSLCFGFNSTYNGIFVTLSGTATGSIISAGCRTKGRALIASGVMTGVSEFEPGSGYVSGLNGTVSPPTVTFTDPNITTLAVVTPRTASGVLASPTFVNRGSGYNNNSTSIYITGNGYADTYQTGLTIILNNLTRLPSPGDNLTISGVSQIYKVTSAYGVFGTATPYLEANVSISPSMNNANSPANGTAVSIRSKYSQVRLTNHDFLNIGYGDQAESNYPGYPSSGYASTPANQVVETNYGRVFFTSTDQDGNFKVGNLFGVQQATGIVTLSASQFGLSGLNTLSLGGIAVGGSSTVITQFSTDGTFTANSDSVIPTQKAIKSYLTSRLTQGGANTFTGQLTAGTVVVGGPNYIRSSIPNGTTGSNVKMVNKVYIDAYGVDGNMAALDFFMRHANHKTNFGFGSK